MTGKGIPLYMENTNSYTEQDKKMFLAGIEYGIIVDHLLHGALLDGFPVQRENIRRIYKMINDSFEGLKVKFKNIPPEGFEDSEKYFSGLDIVFMTISEKSENV